MNRQIPDDVDTDTPVPACIRGSILTPSFSSRNETKSSGFSVIVDAQKSSWRVARTHLRYLNTCLGGHLHDVFVIRPDTFWDTQHVVDNCAKTQKKKGEVRAPYLIFTLDCRPTEISAADA